MITVQKAQEKIARIQNEKVQNSTDIKKNREALKANEAAWKAARDELSRKLEELDAPFKAENTRLNEKVGVLDNQCSDLNWAGRMAEFELVYARTVEVFGCMTAEAMSAYLHMCGIHMGTTEAAMTNPAKLKAKGLSLFKYQPEYTNYVLNFVVRDFDIVAVHLTEKASHPGDWSTYKGWIGTDLLNENVVKVKNDESTGYYRTYDGNASFREWLDVLAETPSENLVAIDIAKNADAIREFI